MRCVYLVGVNHKYQLGLGGFMEGTPEEFAEFGHFVRDCMARYDVRAIAEEMSHAALRKHFISSESVPRILADAAGLPHRYCDPDPETRKRLNITSIIQREQHWIQELASFDTFPVLFILGADHIDSFSSLLSERGFTPHVVEPDWQPSADATPAA